MTVPGGEEASAEASERSYRIIHTVPGLGMVGMGMEGHGHEQNACGRWFWAWGPMEKALGYGLCPAA